MQSHIIRFRWAARWATCLAVCVAVVLLADSAGAQLLRGRLRPPPLQIEAIAGEPYGVGRWTLELPPGVNPALLGNNGFTLTEKNDRVLFQAFEAMPFRTAARELLGRPQLATVYFLFTGDEPLDLKLYAPTAVPTTVTPRVDSVAHARLLSDWWVKYTRQANRIDRPADYPDVVDDYLLAMLSRRLNLPPASQVPPSPVRMLADTLLSTAMGGQLQLPGTESGDAVLDQQAGLLFGSDGLRSSLHAQVMARRGKDAEPADQPLPAGMQFTANVPEVLGDVAIEPIASHVPAECLYMRFGSFANYQWFRQTMQRWGGDLQNLVSRRSVDFGMTSRIERQLSLKESALAQLLGPAVISDVAMIGADTFFREGAAIGMLFQARNRFALTGDFSRQRAATLQNVPGCKEEQIDIAGHRVSFLHTPDNRVRSFYAIDGDYHLVTNSRHLVERFFAAGQGKDSLGDTAEFRFARSLMPADHNYTVFTYLSGEFFRNLAWPHYQVEMQRRIRSAAEIDMALVAQYAARAEGRKVTSLNELIDAGFLPKGFGTRPDGSTLEMTDSGELVDTLRGGRGSFTPVPDVEFDRITQSELARYRQFAEWFQSKWTQLDPVVAGIRRQPGKTKDTEHVVLDVQLTPLAVQNYETLASALGPISRQQLAPIPGNIVAGEVILNGNRVAANGVAANGVAANGSAEPQQGPYRLFGGLRDADPSVEMLGPEGNAPPAAGPQIRVNGRPLLEGLAGGGPLGGLLGGATQGASPMPEYYFGAYPAPAVFRWLGVGEVPLDAAGYGHSPHGMWQRRQGEFTTASPQREVLEIVTPQLRFVEAQRPAQLWLHVGDLSRSKLAGTINGLFYRMAKNAAVGNVRFLHTLTVQLRVPPEEALELAETLTDARLVSSLGGEYKLEEKAGTLPMWVSTALPADKMRLVDGLFEGAPPDFTAPVLDWLRELQADVALDQRTLSLHAEVEMQTAGPPQPIPPAAATQPAAPSPSKPQPEKEPNKKPEPEELPPP